MTQICKRCERISPVLITLAYTEFEDGSSCSVCEDCYRELNQNIEIPEIEEEDYQ